MESLLCGAPCSVEGCSTSIERSVVFGLARTNPRSCLNGIGGLALSFV